MRKGTELAVVDQNPIGFTRDHQKPTVAAEEFDGEVPF